MSPVRGLMNVWVNPPQLSSFKTPRVPKWRANSNLRLQLFILSMGTLGWLGTWSEASLLCARVCRILRTSILMLWIHVPDDLGTKKGIRIEFIQRFCSLWCFIFARQPTSLNEMKIILMYLGMTCFIYYKFPFRNRKTSHYSPALFALFIHNHPESYFFLTRIDKLV